MKAKYLTILVSLIGSLLLSGCAGSEGDPAKKYRNLKPVPPHNEKPEVQHILERDVLDVRVEDNKELIFIEKEERSYTIHAEVRLDGVAFELVAPKFPKNLRRLQAGINTWVFTWTPPALPYDALDSEIELLLQFRIIDVTNQRSKFTLDRLLKEKRLTLKVQKTREQPSILKVSLPKEIKQGQVISFPVEVSDPGSTSANPPILTDFWDPAGKSGERPRADGSVGVRIHPDHQIPKLQNGKWVFVMQLDSNRVVKEAQTEDKNKKPLKEIETEFTLKANNRITNLSSPDSTQRMVITLRPQPEAPEIVWWGSPKIVAGQEAVMQLTAVSRPEGSQIKINIGSANAQLEKWPGNPKLTCAENESESGQRDCQIHWQVPCAANGKEYKLKVSASSQIEEMSKQSNHERTFSITGQADSCAAKGK